MRAAFSLLLLLGQAVPAFADSTTQNLFILQKPVNPENLAQTYVPVGANCNIGNIDFYWLMNRMQPKPPNSTLRCNLLRRLRLVNPDPNNKAGCPKELPPGAACFQKFIMVEELGKTGENLPLVIRSIKSASTGKCSVAAFVDLGDKVVQVRQINANGRILSQNVLTLSADVQFSSVEIIGVDGQVAKSLKCQRGCTETIKVDMGCSLN